MKIAISGKGGAGKTTISAGLSLLYAQLGEQVTAIDADPDSNLATVLGIAPEVKEKIVPLSQMEDLIEERTGAKKGSYGSYFKLNPRVDDLPERFAVEVKGVHLLVLGEVKTAGSGCYCPENVLLGALVSHLVLARKEVVILDMEAGIEHLSRGSIGSVDALLAVTEPSSTSVETTHRIEKMARQLGLKRVLAVGNKITAAADEDFLRRNLKEIEIAAFFPWREEVRRAEREHKPLLPLMESDLRLLHENLAKAQL